jgi:hypothetical protein
VLLTTVDEHVQLWKHVVATNARRPQSNVTSTPFYDHVLVLQDAKPECSPVQCMKHWTVQRAPECPHVQLIVRVSWCAWAIIVGTVRYNRGLIPF